MGKSRLVEEILDRAGLPYVFYTSSTRSAGEELELFTREVAASNLPSANVFRDVHVSSWDAALRLLVAALPPDRPSLIVFDELPYLTVADPAFEGTLQSSSTVTCRDYLSRSSALALTSRVWKR